MIQRVQPFATSLSKVKASKLVKLLVDTYLELDATSGRLAPYTFRLYISLDIVTKKKKKETILVGKLTKS